MYKFAFVLFLSACQNQQFMRSTDDELFVNVSAHVLATPVIADLNQDGIIEELLVPVSYYFDTGLYRYILQTPSIFI